MRRRAVSGADVGGYRSQGQADAIEGEVIPWPLITILMRFCHKFSRMKANS